MKKNTKNFIAKLLVLCMIVGLVPAVTLAAGAASSGTTYTYTTAPDTTTPAPEETVKEEVPAKATTDADGTAKSEVSSADLDKAIKNVLADVTGSQVPEVEIKVAVSSDATALEVALPTDSLNTLATSNSKAELSVTSDLGGIKLDNTALRSLVGQAGSSVTLEVAAAKTENMNSAQAAALDGKDTNAVKAYDMSLLSDGKAISSFNKGKLTLSLPAPTGSSSGNVRAYYLNDAGKFERHRDAKLVSGKVEFSTTHLSTYVVSTTPLTTEFADVPNTQYYAAAVDWAVAYGITDGIGNNLFAPGNTCTRAQFVTFLYRAAGSPSVADIANPFTDVSATTHKNYYNAILWGYSEGIIKGSNAAGTVFSPDAPVNRGQAVTMMNRYAVKNNMATKTGTSTFTDVSATTHKDYYEAIGWAKANGISNGKDTAGTTFGPLDNCVRGQMITFLHRLFVEPIA